jgi:hypothetical protein
MGKEVMYVAEVLRLTRQEMTSFNISDETQDIDVETVMFHGMNGLLTK